MPHVQVGTPLSRILSRDSSSPFWAHFSEYSHTFVDRCLDQTSSDSVRRLGFEVFVSPFLRKLDFGIEQFWATGGPITWPFHPKTCNLYSLCELLPRAKEARFSPYAFWELDQRPANALTPTGLFVVFDRKRGCRKKAILEKILAETRDTEWAPQLEELITRLPPLKNTALMTLGFIGGRAGSPVVCQLAPLAGDFLSGPRDRLTDLLKHHLGSLRPWVEELLRNRCTMHVASNFGNEVPDSIGLEFYAPATEGGTRLDFESYFASYDGLGIDRAAATLANDWRDRNVFHIKDGQGLGRRRKLNHIKIVVSAGKVIGIKMYLSDRQAAPEVKLGPDHSFGITNCTE